MSSYPFRPFKTVSSGALIAIGLGILCFFGLAALFIYAIRERRSQYYYDVKTDSSYDFSRCRCRSVAVQISGGKLILPPRESPEEAIFGALRVRATMFGHWFEPHVEIHDDAQILTQSFERGGAGLRYVNLSSLEGRKQTEIRLRGKFLEVRDQQAMLHYVSSDVDLSRQRILVISAHPDDAEIAAFGLYSHRDAYVLTVTAGEGGSRDELGSFKLFGGSLAHLEKGKTRAWNSVTVPMLAGVSLERTANLGYFDGTLQAMHKNSTTPVKSLQTSARSLDVFGLAPAADFVLPRAARSATWGNLVEDLAFAVQRANPDLIVTPYPRLDAHPDHKLATTALIDALRTLNWRRGSLLLYTNHAEASAWYPYGRTGSVMSLPPLGSGVLFDGLLSNSLNVAEQGRKRIALDAMNDLRTFPVQSPAAALWQLLQALKAAFRGDDQSYFRRAVRRNELFFEIKASSLYEPGIAAAILGEPVPAKNLG